MPPLQPQAIDDQETKAIDDPETDVKGDPETDVKDDQGTDVKDDQGKTAKTEERKMLATKIEVVLTNAPSETRKQEANGAITKKLTESQRRTKSTEAGKKIETIRKDLGTGTEINLVNDQTKKTLEKIGGPIKEKTKRCPKRKASVVFSPSFSASRPTSRIVKRRGHSQSGSL